MKRLLILLIAGIAIWSVACGGGDRPSSEAPESVDEPTAESRVNDGGASTGDSVSREDQPGPSGSESASRSNGVLGRLFSLGLGGATGTGPGAVPGLQQGGGELEQYLLTADDVPDGFTPIGTFSFKMPADVTADFPGGEMAAAMFMSGDSASSTPGKLLMSIVMRPDDPSALDDLTSDLDEFSEEEIREAFGGDGSFLGIEITDVEELDTSGLGDDAAGVGLTMDMSAFFEKLGEAFGEDLPEGQLDQAQAFSKIRMRMYLFGAGDKLGMLMQMGFGDAPELADDQALAEDLYSNLQ